MLKSIALNILSTLVKSSLSKLIIMIIVRLVYFYEKNDNEVNKKTILVLNSERFNQDLISLTSDSRIRLLILPSRIQTLINSLFLDRNQSYEVSKYLKPDNEVKELVKFISRLIIALDRRYNLCGVLTCSFYYRQDLPYQSSSLQTNIPYYVLFKEYMKDDCIVDLNIERFRKRGYKFLGKKIFAANSNIKHILIEAGVCTKDQVSIVGSPRFDSVFRGSNLVDKGAQKIITLFSFLHSSGGLQVNDSSKGNFFSDDHEVGFYHLFDHVHAAIAELALENPKNLFYIKTKWAGPWFERITSSIMQNTGIDIENIPNLLLDSEEDAQSLILRSSVIVAFNSTTVLEASLLGRNLITPIFCEAKEKYLDTNVYFKEFLGSLTTASSKEDLKNKINVFPSNEVYNKIPEKMVSKFIHSFDGKSGERIVNEISRKD